MREYLFVISLLSAVYLSNINLVCLTRRVVKSDMFLLNMEYLITMHLIV